MTVGFVGTGAITGGIVKGFSTEGGPRHAIRLSPRNAAAAEGLARRFENVSVCASNQEVIDSSNVVVVAVRPQVAEEVLGGLRFSSHQNVISLVAGFSTERLAGLGIPAGRISRAIPLPAVADRRSPIAVFPPGSAASDLFGPLGQVFEIEREDQLIVFSTATSTMAAYFGYVGCIASWMTRKGIPEGTAREYLARMFAGLSSASVDGSGRTFEDLATAHATPGGLNEQVLRDLTNEGVFSTLAGALDRVHLRAANATIPSTARHES